ncbi:exocyst complex component 7-like, partial [Microtus ochrogaster]|uniref:Exocyst complex component 7 n=1 Tax=Microtus ochrogaster TaxID=79684 RepID=A0ABM1AZA7_MICOH
KLLFERGKESLESEFRSLMTRHSKVVSPVLILDLISGYDDLEVQEDVTLEHLPESVLKDVIRISRWLVEYGRNQEAFLLQVSILSSFESRLMKLENSIIPVHKQTENLQRLQDNVEKTLSCLDHVISYYHVASDTEKIIREGPTGRLEEYLGSMAKIQKAVEYFQDNSPDSPELNKVVRNQWDPVRQMRPPSRVHLAILRTDLPRISSLVHQ